MFTLILGILIGSALTVRCPTIPNMVFDKFKKFAGEQKKKLDKPENND